MLPVSVTAVVLRIIFELKLADIVINVTAGGPGGATDTVSSFIYREYRDRSNVGYGTMLAEVYLIIIIIFVIAAPELGQPLDAAGHVRRDRSESVTAVVPRRSGRNTPRARDVMVGEASLSIAF